MRNLAVDQVGFASALKLVAVVRRRKICRRTSLLFFVLDIEVGLRSEDEEAPIHQFKGGRLILVLDLGGSQKAPRKNWLIDPLTRSVFDDLCLREDDRDLDSYEISYR